MLRHILTSAVFAGIVAGLFAAVMNLWAVIPMVMEGELYESGDRTHFAVDGSPQSDAGSPSILEDSGLIWGLCGFLTFQLAPAMGMPPQLPATPGPDVVARQIWWAITVLCTGAALGLIAFGRGVVPIAIAIALLFTPHVIGAPRLDTYFGFAAPELAAHFAGASLAVTALTWTTLGLCCAWFWTRLEKE